ncbi:MAG: TonB-dependent receptor plug domain-containing protein [Gemmatimonadetes bacterium]|nr:TonB-dependent receptor plug domain-containing protein [Gemmatimonadota bacterium]
MGRTTVVRRADAAREAGVGTMAGLLQQLPLVQLRAARGETALALRGTRREQLLITLDGLPLNDPATGVADAAELPLALIDAATLRLGADPQRAPGAVGGELALTSASRPVLALRAGAFGERQLEGVARRVGTHTVWHAAAAWQQARNDFPFVNTAGATPTREQRVNNDEARATLAAGATGAAWQVALLAAWRERGMVGPANVRAFDDDRARTERLLLRARRTIGATRLVAGSRWMTLDYRDPARPVLDRSAVAGASDVEWQGGRGGMDWQVIAGMDHLAATGDIRQRRQRGGAAARWRSADAARTRWEVGTRLDAITGAGVVPGGSAAVERALGARLLLTIRAASAVRAPTLYDLHFAAPQRLAVAPLAPERVRADVAAGVRTAGTAAQWRWTLSGTAVGRTVRDAIVWFPGNFGWSPANVGTETLRGGEAMLDAQHPRARLSAWGTRYAAFLRSGALRIPTPYVAPWAGGGQLQWRSGAHTLSATLRTMGRRPFTAGPRASAFDLPAAALLDVALARRIGRDGADLLMTVALDNATNHAWEPVRGYPAPGRALSLSVVWGASAPRTP